MSHEPTASEFPPTAPPVPVPMPGPGLVPVPATIEYERVFDERRLHPATIIVQAVRFARSILFLLVIVVVARVAGRKADTVEIIAGITGGLSVVGAVMKYISVRFSIRDGALHVSSGIIERQRRTIPLERIQNINIKQELIHRLLGVADVRIETASGGAAEAELSVVSLQDAQLIRAVLTSSPVTNVVDAPAAEVLYRASLWQLVLAGATQNRIGTLLAGIAGAAYFVSSVFGNESSFFRQVAERVSRVHYVPAWTQIALVAFGAVAVGWFASMALTIVSRYGFALTRTGGQLHRSFGLLTRHESLFPVERVQVLRIVAPLLQRWVGLCRVNVETAGSFKEGEKENSGTNELCPIITRQRVGEICRLVLSDYRPEETQFELMHPLARRRAFVRIMAGFVLISVPLALLVSKWLWLIPVGAVPVAWLWAGLYFRSVGLALNEQYLVVRKGILAQQVEVVPLGKAQATFVRQSPLQKRLGLATFELLTAGGLTGDSVSIPDVAWRRAIEVQERVGEGTIASIYSAGFGERSVNRLSDDDARTSSG